MALYLNNSLIPQGYSHMAAVCNSCCRFIGNEIKQSTKYCGHMFVTNFRHFEALL